MQENDGQNSRKWTVQTESAENFPDETEGSLSVDGMEPNSPALITTQI